MSDSARIEIEKQLVVQIDHIRCGECGHDMQFDATSDSCGDIQISNCYCESCSDDVIKLNEELTEIKGSK